MTNAPVFVTVPVLSCQGAVGPHYACLWCRLRSLCVHTSISSVLAVTYLSFLRLLSPPSAHGHVCLVISLVRSPGLASE